MSFQYKYIFFEIQLQLHLTLFDGNSKSYIISLGNRPGYNKLQ